MGKIGSWHEQRYRICFKVKVAQIEATSLPSASAKITATSCNMKITAEILKSTHLAERITMVCTLKTKKRKNIMIYNIMINMHDISTRGKFHSICPLCINTAAMTVYWKVDAQ